jgi:hypothetical protein
MRLFAAIAAVALLAGALPTGALADGTSPIHLKLSVTRHARIVHHRWRHGHRRPVYRAAVTPQVPIYFAWNIPATSNPGYDRAMVLLLHSPAVSGIYTDDPGYPATPVVNGVAPYQRDVCCGVFQYDGTTGEYIQLSQADAAHAIRPPGDVPIPAPPP